MATNIGITLPLRRSVGGYFEATQDILTQLKSNMTNLLLTQKGERPFQPEFGSDLHAIVFEPMTDDGLSNVQGAIESAVSQWMPFIQVENVEVEQDVNHNKIFVRITFSLSTDKNILDSITLVF